MYTRIFAIGVAAALFGGVFSTISAAEIYLNGIQAECPCRANKPGGRQKPAPKPQNQNVKEKLVLVIGCPRSGTLYATKALKHSGLDIGHEAMGSQGIVSWLFSADSSNPAWGPLPTDYHFKTIFHQVRHPLKCIATLHLIVPKSWDYVCREVPEIKRDEPILVRAAKMWVYWNLKAEKKAEMTYRVEAMAEAFPEMSRRLGVPLDLEALEALSKETHSKNHKVTVTWNDLHEALEPGFYQKLVNLAQRYGYDVTEGAALIR